MATLVRVGSNTGCMEGPSCPMCDAELFKRHCKYICPQHGPVVDCSDPFTF